MRGRETSLSRTGFPADGRLVFLRFFEVKRLHAVKMPRGVYGMLQVLRAIGHGMCTVRDVSDE